jgi:hypothetical protein
MHKLLFPCFSPCCSSSALASITRSATSIPSACSAIRRCRQGGQKSWNRNSASASRTSRSQVKQARDLQSASGKGRPDHVGNRAHRRERELANMSRDIQRNQREFREDLNQRKNEEFAHPPACPQTYPGNCRKGKIRPDRGERRLRQPARRHHRPGHEGPGALTLGVPGIPTLELQAQLGGVLHGETDPLLTGVAALTMPAPTHLSFVVGQGHLKAARNSRAGALWWSVEMADRLSRPCLVVDNPHAAFARAIACSIPEARARPGVHPSAHRRSQRHACRCVEDRPARLIGAGCEDRRRHPLGPSGLPWGDARRNRS